MSRRRKRRKHNKFQPPMFDHTGISRDHVIPTNKGTFSVSYSDCDHWRTPFKLAVGTVYASAWRDRHTAVAYRATIEPDLGFYLCDNWQENAILTTPGVNIPFARRNIYPRILYPWMDGGAPENVQRVTDAVVWLHDEVTRGRTIDIGCFGAHGRTGVILAMLCVVEGMDAWTAIRHVRKEYCDEAIETTVQIDLVRKVENLLAGRPIDDSLDSDERPSTGWAGASTSSPGGASPIGYCQVCQKETYDIIAHKRMSHTNDTDYDPDEAILLYQTDIVEESIPPHVLDNLDSDEIEYFKRGSRRGQDSLQTGADLQCAEPPCSFPYDCNLIEGDCWKYETGDYHGNSD